jgi:pSer/pThr/pTyr-binding forkhead associated (FHA) protein
MMELHVFNRAGSLLRAFALGDNHELIVGREEHCDIRIRSRNVSREHCSIERNGDGRFYLRDLGSTCGTKVNGERIERVPLSDGLEVSIGPALLKFIDGELG